MRANTTPRKELLAIIERILRQTPKRLLRAAFGPVTVAIQSAPSSDRSRPPAKVQLTSDELCLLEVAPYSYSPRSRSPGCYFYAWDAVTERGGLFMDPCGKFYRAGISGKGEFTNFPTLPGDTRVSLSLVYVPEDLSLKDLTDADLEVLLRKLLNLSLNSNIVVGNAM
jgi:hypothetical protein